MATRQTTLLHPKLRLNESAGRDCESGKAGNETNRVINAPLLFLSLSLFLFLSAPFFPFFTQNFTQNFVRIRVLCVLIINLCLCSVSKVFGQQRSDKLLPRNFRLANKISNAFVRIEIIMTSAKHECNHRRAIMKFVESLQLFFSHR